MCFFILLNLPYLIWGSGGRRLFEYSKRVEKHWNRGCMTPNCDFVNFLVFRSQFSRLGQIVGLTSLFESDTERFHENRGY